MRFLWPPSADERGRIRSAAGAFAGLARRSGHFDPAWTLLGLRLSRTAQGARLHLAPRLPAGWPGIALDSRYRQTPYLIEVTQGRADEGPVGMGVDGLAQDDMALLLVDDARMHRVAVRLHLSA